MYHVSAQGVDERMINVHYYYYWLSVTNLLPFEHHRKNCSLAGSFPRPMT